MKKFTRIQFLIFSALTMCGCQETRVSRFRAEWPNTVERARAQVLTQMPKLDDASREMVRTNEPKLIVVRILYPVSDYKFVWPISSNRMVELDAGGDYRHLDGKPVKIRESTTDQR